MSKVRILPGVLILALIAGCGPDASKTPPAPASQAPTANQAGAPPAAPASQAAGAIQASAPAAQPAYEATLAEGIQFQKPGYPKFLKSATGMSHVEDFGRWTDGPVVVLTFADPLPGKFVIKLDLETALGPNVGKPLRFKVGDWQGSVVAGGQPQSHELKVKTSAPTNVIEFAPSQPTSPKSLGMSEDARSLGVAVKRLSISRD